LWHPSLDSYWLPEDVELQYSQLTIPTLSIGGWYDIFNLGEVGNFQGMQTRGGSALARNNAHLIMYATCHACPTGTAVGDLDYGPRNALNLPAVELRWFDHWLKGADNGVQNMPAVRLFVMEPPDSGSSGTGFWVKSSGFPLPGTTDVNYYLSSNGHANTLGGDGTLGTSQASATTPDSYRYDPRNPVPTVGGNMCCINGLLPSGAFDQRAVEQRPDVLVYSSAPLTRAEAVAGHVVVKLSASSSAPDTDFTAKLVDVHPDGFAQNIADGIIRARYRDSLTDPTLITPGVPYKYTIDLGNTAVVFRPGHQIRLEISSSNFPHYDRNPNTGARFAQTAQVRTATQTILHGGDFQSYVTLPVAPITVPATP
jgi:putative CocE/NonD family hydrolase